MKHTVRFDQFVMKIEYRILESDLDSLSNTLMFVELKDEGFKIASKLEIDVYDLIQFCNDLKLLYDFKKKQAVIKEAYGKHQFLMFNGDGMGHIRIDGIFVKHRCNENRWEMEFSFQIDQTSLKEFVETLDKSLTQFHK